ncbi:hypothetical protein BD770DRAFT_19215 [Pilaira anomala]|nr:hypothetical protein BD770DRAFT_19215 [Pilaira anomala]
MIIFQLPDPDTNVNSSFSSSEPYIQLNKTNITSPFLFLSTILLQHIYYIFILLFLLIHCMQFLSFFFISIIHTYTFLLNILFSLTLSLSLSHFTYYLSICHPRQVFGDTGTFRVF